MRSAFFLSLVVLLTATPACAETAPLPTTGTKDMEVVLRITDKVGARSTLIRASVGTVISYDELEILVERCVKQSMPGPDRFSALLAIYQKNRTAPEQLFSGWMFSASPSLSALEHPTYDLVLVSCAAKEKPKEKKEEKPGGSGPDE